MEIMKYEAFDKCLVELRRRGGSYQRASEQVFSILGRLQGDPDALADLPKTHHGESRIKKAVKYDLSGFCRLITIQDSGYVFFCFVGDHGQCDKWLDKNRGLIIKTHKGTKPLVTFESLDIANPNGRLERGIGLSPKPLVDLLAERLRNQVMEGLSKLVQKTVKQMDAAVSDDDLLEAAESVVDPVHGAALFDTLIFLRDGDTESAERRVMAFTGELKDVEASVVAAKALVDSEDFRRIPIDSEHYRRLIEHYAANAEYRDWMLFMHPDQQRFVDDDYAGPAKLSGVSGSGKTCIVVNRAIALAQRYPNERILVLTLNKSLATLIDSLVKKAALPDLLERIDTHAFFTVCQNFLSEFEPENVKIYDETTWKSAEHIDEIWREFYRCELNNYSARVLQRLHDSLIARGIDAESYIREEFDWIRSATGPDSRADYLTMERTGRSYPLDKGFREELLQGLGYWEAKMRQIGVTDYIGLANATYRHIDRIKPAYRCVLVDESQDFGTIELKIVRRLVQSHEGPAAINNIFLCGDAAQRISSKQRSLGDANMHVPGPRSFTLALNYRNSREILELAHAILVENLSEEMLDSKDFDVLDPKFANFSGPVPLLLNAPNLADEVRHAIAYAEQEAQHNPNAKICIAICGYTQHELATFAARLSLPLLDGAIDLGGGSIFLSDLENTKGFEFQCMIILNANTNVLPYPHSFENERFRDLSRFYVAMTRARQQLIVSHSGTPSPYLGKNRAKFLEESWSLYLDTPASDALPEFLPMHMEQMRRDDEESLSLNEMAGEEFLYRDDAIGLPILLIQRLRELISGKSVIRTNVPVEWMNLGTAVRDLTNNPRSRQAFGPEALNLFREHVQPLVTADMQNPRKRMGIRRGQEHAVADQSS
jgi:superfamily I DNA/RNA helicase